MYLQVGRFFIALDEIVAIYRDSDGVRIALKHGIGGPGGSLLSNYCIFFENGTAEADALIKWAKRHAQTLDD